MNRIIPLILLLFVFASCTKSDNDKAQELVKNYCNNTFFSPEDYSPIAFETLKEYYKPYEQSTEYLALDDRRQKLESKKDSLYALMYDGNKKLLYKPITDSLDRVMANINADIVNGKNTYKGKQEGWMMRHTYSKKDEAGRVVQGRSVFIMDKDLTKVVQAIDE